MPLSTYATLRATVAVAFGAVAICFGIFCVVSVYQGIPELHEAEAYFAMLGMLFFGAVAIVSFVIGALLIRLGRKRLRKPPEAP